MLTEMNSVGKGRFGLYLQTEIRAVFCAFTLRRTADSCNSSDGGTTGICWMWYATSVPSAIHWFICNYKSKNCAPNAGALGL